jgi:hypothetical protein
MRRVLGIMTVLGALWSLLPSAASAQAIGTLQVEARVTAADSEWSSLWAAQQLAGSAAEHLVSTPTARVTLPLSEVRVVSPNASGLVAGRPALISVQYLRN